MITENQTDKSNPREVGEFIQDYTIEPGRQDSDGQEIRRKHRRYALGESVDIMLDSSQRPAEVLTATGRDVSLGGIGIYSHRPISVGTDMVVSIDNGSNRLVKRAVAVHSTLSVGLFKIGARFEGDQ